LLLSLSVNFLAFAGWSGVRVLGRFLACMTAGLLGLSTLLGKRQAEVEA
jgi:hypothetical protein